MPCDDVSVSPLIALQARSLAAAVPGRFWVPPDDQLRTLAPGDWVKLRVVTADEKGEADLWAAHTVWVELGQIVGNSLAGSVRAGGVEGSPYTAGAEVTFTASQVVDIAHRDDAGRPFLNAERAASLVGRRICVGLTIVDAGGAIVERRQFAGTIGEAHPRRGVRIERGDGTDYWLPPDIRGIEEAPPGEYHLHSTGEVVVDPDYIVSWTVEAPAEGEVDDAGYAPGGDEV